MSVPFDFNFCSLVELGQFKILQINFFVSMDIFFFDKFIHFTYSGHFYPSEFTSKLFTDAGFEVVEIDYIYRSTVNKKEGIDVPRIFVQGKFRKKA